MNFRATSPGNVGPVPSQSPTARERYFRPQRSVPAADSGIATEFRGTEWNRGSADRERLIDSMQREETLVRVELMILGIDLKADTGGRDGDEKRILTRAVKRGLRRIVRPMADLSIHAEGDSVGIVVGDREIDLGPEIQRWFLDALRSGKTKTGIFEVSLPLSWLRPAVAAFVHYDL